MKNVENISLQPNKKIYFVSDFHLGAPNLEESRSRERRIIRWLDEISKDAQAVFLLGDIFDFWFEYKHVVPKGHVRMLGKLAEMADNGIDLRLFVGNHDLWTFGYLEKEIGIKIYRKPQLIKINETLCFLGHGDGLGPYHRNYKHLKKLFTCRYNQHLLAFLHPWIGVGLASFFSQRSRVRAEKKMSRFIYKEGETLDVFCKEYLQKNPDVSYFIFGHRHLPLEVKISEKSTYFNTGDWVDHNSYLELKMENGKPHVRIENFNSVEGFVVQSLQPK